MGLHVMSPLVDLLICGRRWLFIGVLFAGPPLQIVSASATAQEAVLSNGSEDGSRIMVLVCAILAVGLTLLGALLLWLSGNRAGSTRQAGPPQGVGVGSPALAPVPVPESAPKAVVEPLPDADPTEAVLKRMMKASGHAAQPGAQAADENIPKNRWRATVARVGPAYISVRSTFDNVDGLYQRMPQLVRMLGATPPLDLCPGLMYHGTPCFAIAGQRPPCVLRRGQRGQHCDLVLKRRMGRYDS